MLKRIFVKSINFLTRNTIFLKFMIGYPRNLYNRMKYGKHAPKYGEKIWIDPNHDDIFKGKSGPRYDYKDSAKVFNDLWFINQDLSMSNTNMMKICQRHWIEGLSWKDSGAYDWMFRAIKVKGAIDGYSNEQGVLKRYALLDEIFNDIRINRQFNKEFQPNIHLGPNGKLYFGHGGGKHRLCIAYILKVPFQARIGCVHVSAISRLNELRKRKINFTK